jgi:hypothetical protein
VVEVAIEEDLVHIRRQVHLRMLDQACPEPLCTASGTVDDREVRQTQVVSDVQVEPLLCQWFLPDHVLISSRFPCPLGRISRIGWLGWAQVGIAVQALHEAAL